MAALTAPTPVSAVYATNMPKPTSPLVAEERPKKKKVPRQSVLERCNASPIHIRARLNETYEPPISSREGWWRCTIKETPAPGAYESGTFVKEITVRPNTYRFKSDGRKRDPTPQIGHGAHLLPGAYEHKDFLNRLDRFNTTYGFKDTGRDKRDFLNFGKKDKDINVAPCEYDTDKYLTCSVERAPSKHWVFKSQSQRFPTGSFRPKEGPAPGNYEYEPPASLHPISSSFKSKTPRFSSSHTKVPGPGTYEKAFQSPIPKTILKMGRQHGIFFSSAFQV